MPKGWGTPPTGGGEVEGMAVRRRCLRAKGTRGCMGIHVRCLDACIENERGSEVSTLGSHLHYDADAITVCV